ELDLPSAEDRPPKLQPEHLAVRALVVAEVRADRHGGPRPRPVRRKRLSARRTGGSGERARRRDRREPQRREDARGPAARGVRPGAQSVRPVGRYRRRGRCVPRSTLSAVLPRRALPRPVRPCVAIAMQSTFASAASSRMPRAGEVPAFTEVVTLRPRSERSPACSARYSVARSWASWMSAWFIWAVCGR